MLRGDSDIQMTSLGKNMHMVNYTRNEEIWENSFGFFIHSYPESSVSFDNVVTEIL